MVENGYPVPSYMADVFEKSHGWVETPEQPKESLLAAPGENGGHSPMQKIYAIDCEMVRLAFIFCDVENLIVTAVLNGRRQRTHESLHH
jgi:hypothetical protein